MSHSTRNRGSYSITSSLFAHTCLVHGIKVTYLGAWYKGYICMYHANSIPFHWAWLSGPLSHASSSNKPWYVGSGFLEYTDWAPICVMEWCYVSDGWYTVVVLLLAIAGCQNRRMLRMLCRGCCDANGNVFVIGRGVVSITRYYGTNISGKRRFRRNVGYFM